MRAGALVGLAVLAIATAGFAPFGPSGEPVSGDVVVAGSGIRAYTSSGALREIVAPATGTSGIHAVAVAVGPDHTVYTASQTPVLQFYKTDGTHGFIGEYPDGFEVTALDASASRLYVAISDGGFLHQIFRVTFDGVHDFPFVAESRVTSLAIASDDCTLLYATEKRGIRRLDVCTRSPSKLFSSVAARSIALLPDATLLVAPLKGNAILQLSPAGQILRRYRSRGVGAWRALAVAPDGTSFWAATADGAVYRFSLSSSAPQFGPRGTIDSLEGLAVVDGARGTAPPLTPPHAEGSLALDGVATLTGEGFVGLADAPPTPPQQCSAPDPATMTFSVPGTTVASGPYAGTFTATQTASIGPQTIAQPSGILGVDVGRMLQLDGSFDIHATDGRRVQGTLVLPHSTGNANTGACLVFEHQTFPHSVLYPPNLPLSGYYRDLHGRKLEYRASIQSGGRTYFDEGKTALFTDNYYIAAAEGRPGNVYRLSQSFHSELQSVVDDVQSLKTRERHVIVVRGNRKSLTFRIEWPRARDRFTVTGMALTKQSPRTLASSTKLKPGKLKPGGIRVRTTRNGRMLKVVVTKLKPGTVRFAVKPLRLAGATTVETTLLNPSGGS